MNRQPPIWLIALMWIALPLSWREYRQNWEQLPDRMAVHFDAEWRPNGYTSKDGALNLGVGIMATMLVISTVALLLVRVRKPQAAWAALLIQCVVLGVMWYANHFIVDFNLKAKAQTNSQSSAVSSQIAHELLRTDN